MESYPVIRRLPTRYNTAIGRLIVRFSIVEMGLRQFIYALLELDNKLGRVAVKNPRVRDSFTMIEDIMALRSFTTKINIKTLAKECAKIEAFRDKIAHGVWVKHPKSDTPVLQVTAGSYPETQGGKSVKARIKPQALRVTPADFKNYTRGADIAIKTIKQLAREVGAQHAALIQKRIEQQARDRSPLSPRRRQTHKKR
jgi:hypothetical protein